MNTHEKDADIVSLNLQKGDTERIAKAKAEKAASSKKPNEGLTVQPNIGSLTDSANSSTATDAVAKLDVAHINSNSGTTIGNKKSKVKAKAPTARASSADREIRVDNEEETGKLDGAIKDFKEFFPVTHKAGKTKVPNAETVKQEYSDRYGSAWVTEPTPSRAPLAPLMIPESPAPSQKMSAQEVNAPYEPTSNQSTHITGSPVPQIDSNSSLTFSSSTTNDIVPSQHCKSEDSCVSKAAPKN